MRIIDAHGHALLKRGYVRPDGVRFATAVELVDIMDRCGIARTVVLPLTAPECLPTPQSNEEVLAACASFPDRLVPFCNVDPRVMMAGKDTPPYDFRSVLDHYKSLGCKGLGEWMAPLQWDDPRAERLLAACEEAALPVTFHMTSDARTQYGIVTRRDLSDMECALRRFPSLRFIAHSGVFWGAVTASRPDANAEHALGGRAAELLCTCDNLWADLSATSAYTAITSQRDAGYRFLAEFQDSLLFGTDLFLVGSETPDEIRRLAHACEVGSAASEMADPPVIRLLEFLEDGAQAGLLSRAAYEKIMEQNAAELLGIP